MVRLKKSSDLSIQEQIKFQEIIFKINGLDLSSAPIDQFIRNNHKWESDNNATFFAIYSEDTIVGSISLSKIDWNAKTGSCGYQIKKEYRNRGIASDAFRIIIEKAKNLGLQVLYASIEESNEPSKRMWERQGSRLSSIGNSCKIIATLNLEVPGTYT